MVRYRLAAFTISLFAIAALAVPSAFAQNPGSQPGGIPQIPTAVRNRAARDGRVRVIVELKLPSGPHRPAGLLPSVAAAAAQRQSIVAVGARVLARLQGSGHRVVHRYQSVPYLALELSAADLDALQRELRRVEEVRGEAAVQQEQRRKRRGCERDVVIDQPRRI